MAESPVFVCPGDENFSSFVRETEKGMSWTNFHSHSHYCDGKFEIRAHIESALNRGFVAWGCSSHMPVSFPTHWNMQASRLPDYLTEVVALKAEYADRIQLYCGLEMDFIPGKVGSFHEYFRDVKLDYRIGSIHFVDAFEDGRPLEIDGPHSVFLDGLHNVFHGDVQSLVRRYFALTRQMIREDRPDVVGHLDKIKMQSEDGRLFSETDDWYREEMMHTLDVIAEAGVITEVNTRGIYKKVVTETYPSRWVLEIMQARKLPIMLNSDSHHPDEVDGNFAETAAMLRALGFTSLWVLWNGRWTAVPFSSEGISQLPISP